VRGGRGRGREHGGTYSRFLAGLKTRGVSGASGNGKTAGSFRFPGRELGEKKKLTCGSHRAVRGREKEGTGSGEVSGPRARARPRWAAVFLFYFFFDQFPFSFSVFLILLYLLQKGFKSTQTTFRNFLKFKVSKWDS
jgi:hypothetical protein